MTKMWMQTPTNSGEIKRTELKVDFFQTGEADKAELVLRIQFDEKKYIDIGVSEQALQDALMSASRLPAVAKTIDPLDDLLGP